MGKYKELAKRVVKLKPVQAAAKRFRKSGDDVGEGAAKKAAAKKSALDDAMDYKHLSGKNGFAEARKGLDEGMEEVRKTWPKYKTRGTVVGGYNKKTGERAFGISGKDPVTGKQYCGEDEVARKLGADPEDVLLTKAYRPRNRNKPDYGDDVGVCWKNNCQDTYPRENFEPGTSGKPGGPWDDGNFGPPKNLREIFGD